MSVHKDKKRGTWFVKYQNRTKRGFNSKKEADEYEARLKTGLEKPKKKEYHKFSAVASDFLKAKKAEVQYSTYYKSKEIIELHILPNAKDKPIENIVELECRNFKERIASTNLATSYKNNILLHYKAIFKHAQKYFGLNTNPTQFLSPFKKSFKEKIETKKKETNVWNYEEFGKFIKCVDEANYRMLFIVLFFTGLRLGEALALTHADLLDHKLSITKSVTKFSLTDAYEVKDTKNVSSIREVSLNDSLYLLLLDYQNTEKQDTDFQYSWFMFGGVKPLSRTNVSRYKDNAIEKSGVKRITIHQFRHSHATNLINDGVNVVAVSKRLGHSDVSMTLRVYTHLFQKIDEELIDNLEKSSHDLLTDIK
jgi:integrase